MEHSYLEILLVILVMTAGSTLQSTVGFGLGMVAGPIVILIDREYLPGPMLFAAMIMTIVLALREYKSIDLRGLKFSVLGRLVSTPLAAIIVGVISARAFDLLFGVLILVGVGLSMVHRNIQPTGKNVFIAGIASGFMSTICAIGGPPLALVYQNAGGSRLRATLSAMFVVGCLVSLIALFTVGEFGRQDLGRSALLSVGVVLGIVISRPLIGRINDKSVRYYVLGVCTLAAAIVLGRSMLQFF